MKAAYFLAFFCFLTGVAIASDSLITWDFPDEVTVVTQTVPSTTVADGLKSAQLQRKGPHQAGQRPGCWPLAGFSKSPDLDPETYLEFTVAPEEGKKLRLEQMSFFYWMNMKRGLVLELRSGLDDFQTVIDSFYPEPFGNESREGIFGLSNLPEISTPVTFRVYGYNSPGQNQNQFFLGGSIGSSDLVVFGDLVP